MISELNDEEILDFLMNSDFDGDFKPEEFRYLLHKWKYEDDDHRACLKCQKKQVCILDMWGGFIWTYS